MPIFIFLLMPHFQFIGGIEFPHKGADELRELKIWTEKAKERMFDELIGKNGLIEREMMKRHKTVNLRKEINEKIDEILAECKAELFIERKFVAPNGCSLFKGLVNRLEKNRILLFLEETQKVIGGQFEQIGKFELHLHFDVKKNAELGEEPIFSKIKNGALAMLKQIQRGPMEGVKDEEWGWNGNEEILHFGLLFGGLEIILEKGKEELGRTFARNNEPIGKLQNYLEIFWMNILVEDSLNLQNCLGEYRKDKKSMKKNFPELHEKFMVLERDLQFWLGKFNKNGGNGEMKMEEFEEIVKSAKINFEKQRAANLIGEIRNLLKEYFEEEEKIRRILQREMENKIDYRENQHCDLECSNLLMIQKIYWDSPLLNSKNTANLLDSFPDGFVKGFLAKDGIMRIFDKNVKNEQKIIDKFKFSYKQKINKEEGEYLQREKEILERLMRAKWIEWRTIILHISLQKYFIKPGKQAFELVHNNAVQLNSVIGQLHSGGKGGGISLELAWVILELDKKHQKGWRSPKIYKDLLGIDLEENDENGQIEMEAMKSAGRVIYFVYLLMFGPPELVKGEKGNGEGEGGNGVGENGELGAKGKWRRESAKRNRRRRTKSRH